MGANPNPSSGVVNVEFVLPTPDPVQLDLLDVRGRRVLRHDLAKPGPGRHLLHLGVERRLPAGVYVVRLSQAGSVRTAKVVVAR